MEMRMRKSKIGLTCFLAFTLTMGMPTLTCADIETVSPGVAISGIAPTITDDLPASESTIEPTVEPALETEAEESILGIDPEINITIDCRTGDINPMSQAFIQMSAVFAELELSIIRARVKSGMANAKSKGKQIGRRPTTKDDIPAIFYKHYPAFASGQLNVSELARICGLSRPTVYKYLKLVG